MAGIAAWLASIARVSGRRSLASPAGMAIAGFLLVPGRSGRALGWFAWRHSPAAFDLGRATWVAAPRLDHPAVVQFHASVDNVEILTAREVVRLTVAPLDGSLPPIVRVSVPQDDSPPALPRAHGCRFGPGSRRRRRWRFPAPMISPATPGSKGLVRSARPWGLSLSSKRPRPPVSPERAKSLRHHIAAPASRQRSGDRHRLGHWRSKWRVERRRRCHAPERLDPFAVGQRAAHCRGGRLRHVADPAPAGAEPDPGVALQPGARGGSGRSGRPALATRS